MRLGTIGGTRLGAVHDLIRDVRWTGEELATEMARRARVLARRVEADEDNLFVIAHANSPSFFADLFAVWEVGGCAVCVNSGLTPAELRTVVEFVQPRAVLVDELGAMDGASDQAAIDLGVPIFSTAEETAPAEMATLPPYNQDNPALILFTSGTSGDPKGVVHTQRTILSRVSLNQAFIGNDDLARTLCVLPTHFGHGLIGNCLTPLLAGGDIFLMHGGGIGTSAKLGPILDEHRISFMSSVPGVWKVALRVSPQPTAGTLKRIHIGSAPLSTELWQEVIDWSGAREVVNMYGITETANWITGASSARFAPEDGLLGTVWGGQAAVKCEDGSIQREGSGELLLRVPSIMSGYYKRPDLTELVLQNGWYFTGDMGTIDDQGALRLTGRNRYAINIDGIKIYPEEIDLLFERHDNVAEACAFSIQDPVSGETVAAAIRLTDGAEVSERDLQAWARERIRPEAVPKRMFIVPEIPKTDRGKLNRDNVANQCVGGGLK